MARLPSHTLLLFLYRVWQAPPKTRRGRATRQGRANDRPVALSLPLLTFKLFVRTGTTEKRVSIRVSSGRSCQRRPRKYNRQLHSDPCTAEDLISPRDIGHLTRVRDSGASNAVCPSALSSGHRLPKRSCRVSPAQAPSSDACKDRASWQRTCLWSCAPLSASGLAGTGALESIARATAPSRRICTRRLPIPAGESVRTSTRREPLPVPGTHVHVPQPNNDSPPSRLLQHKHHLLLSVFTPPSPSIPS